MHWDFEDRESRVGERCAFDITLPCPISEPGGTCGHPGRCREAINAFSNNRECLDSHNEMHASMEIASLLRHMSPEAKRELGQRLLSETPTGEPYS